MIPSMSIVKARNRKSEVFPKLTLADLVTSTKGILNRKRQFWYFVNNNDLLKTRKLLPNKGVHL